MTNILSIDDSRAVHAFLKDCFSGREVKITDAFNGEEGIKIATTPGNSFDVILLDWEMPGLTGVDVLKELVAKAVTAPIVMLTTKNKVEEISQMLDLGATEYVMKPFTKEILIDKLQSILGREI